jgi:hypothetical protein
MGDNIWVLIPIMGMSIPIFAIWMRHRAQIEKYRASASAQIPAAQSRQQAEQIQALEDRVRVLERIVTDGGYTVAAEIEALRDTRQVEQGSGVPLAIDSRERA